MYLFIALAILVFLQIKEYRETELDSKSDAD